MTPGGLGRTWQAVLSRLYTVPNAPMGPRSMCVCKEGTQDLGGGPALWALQHSTGQALPESPSYHMLDPHPAGDNWARRGEQTVMKGSGEGTVSIHLLQGTYDTLRVILVSNRELEQMCIQVPDAVPWPV